ncbi:MAG: HlyD family efflux transporter periplasmic adaptor subunit [Planctomycetes bacterium]|nr:HlyD family efflux transporter periplasmic adaptor subunit [Planctomycetota bacterium]
MHSVAVVFLSMAIAQSGNAPSSTRLELPYCELTLIRFAEIPARQSGVLESFPVTEGMMVAADQLLAQVDEREAQLRLAAAQREYDAAAEQAKEDVEAQAARAAAAVAEVEHRDSVAVNARSPGAIPLTEVRRQELTAERAGFQVKVAEMEYAVAGHNSLAQEAKVRLIQHEIETRRIIAPFAGYVAERYRQEGEWVQAGDAVLRIVRMDRLRVEGQVKADLFAPHEIEGRPVVIKVALPGRKEHSVEGTILFASQIIEASGEYRVWAEIDNVPVRETEQRTHWLMRPGMSASMSIDIGSNR